MLHVHTPQPSTGTTTFLDVEFHDGVAHLEDLHPVRELALIQHGYCVVREIVGETLESQTVPQLRELALIQHGYCVVREIVGETLESQTVPQLRELAEQEGIVLSPKAKKAEIIQALSDAPARVLSADDLAEGDFAGIPGHVQNADGSISAPGIHEG